MNVWKFSPNKGGYKATCDDIVKATIFTSGRAWSVTFPETPLYNTAGLRSIDAAMGYTVGIENVLKIAKTVDDHNGAQWADVVDLTHIDLREMPVCG